MYTVTYLIDGQQPVTLHFKTRDAAEKAGDNSRDDAVGCVADDFERVFRFERYRIVGVIVTDIAKQTEVEIDMAVRGVRAQEKAAQKARAGSSAITLPGTLRQ